MDKLADGQKDRRRNSWADEQTKRRVGKRMDEWAEGKRDDQMYRCDDGQTLDEWTLDEGMSR